MRRLALLLLPVLAACGDSPITPLTYDAAFRLCTPHGGLKWVTLEASYTASDRVKITCNDNELIAYLSVQKPLPPTPAASAASSSN